MSAQRITPALVGRLVDAAHAYRVGWLPTDRPPPTGAGTMTDLWQTVAKTGHDRTGQILASTAHAGMLEDWGTELLAVTGHDAEPFYTHAPAELAPPLHLIRWARAYRTAAAGAPGWEASEAYQITAGIIDRATIELDGYDSVPWPE